MVTRNFTYANVTATLALFIALGGTSWAVTQLPKNSVGANQLKAGAVTNGKLAKGAVSADKLAAGTVVTGPAGARGPRGAEGPAGAAGKDGKDGTSAVNSDVIVARRTNTAQMPLAGGIITATKVTLPAGVWNLDSSATINYEGDTGSEWFGCSVQSAADTYSGGTTRVGTNAEAVMSAVIPGIATARLTTQTDVSLNCGHPSAILGPNPTVRDAVIRATRVASVDER